jgi:hypothetical protein
MSSQPHTQATLPVGEKTDTHYTGDCVGPKVSLCAVVKRKIQPLVGSELQSCPSQSIY